MPFPWNEGPTYTIVPSPLVPRQEIGRFQSASITCPEVSAEDLAAVHDKWTRRRAVDMPVFVRNGRIDSGVGPFQGYDLSEPNIRDLANVVAGKFNGREVTVTFEEVSLSPWAKPRPLVIDMLNPNAVSETDILGVLSHYAALKPTPFFPQFSAGWAVKSREEWLSEPLTPCLRVEVPSDYQTLDQHKLLKLANQLMQALGGGWCTMHDSGFGAGLYRLKPYAYKPGSFRRNPKEEAQRQMAQEYSGRGWSRLEEGLQMANDRQAGELAGLPLDIIQGSVREFKRATTIAPDLADACLGLGLALYLAQTDSNATEQALDTALRRNHWASYPRPKDDGMSFHLARAVMGLVGGHTQDCVVDCDTLLSLPGEFAPWLRSFVEQLRLKALAAEPPKS